MKLFGREPAVWVALIQAAIAFLGPNVFDWSLEQTAVVFAASVAILDTYVAWRAHQTMLGVVVGLTKALLAAAVAFGGHINDETAAQIIALVTAAIGGFQRQATDPLPAKGNFDLTA